MSLHPHVIAPVPEETARVARAAFPKGHPYLTFRDALGTIFQDEDFATLLAQNERGCHQRQCSYSTHVFRHLWEAMNHPKSPDSPGFSGKILDP